MAIAPSDIVARFSSGSASSSTFAGKDASLGGQMTGTAWTGGALHDLFDEVSGTENVNSDVEYRAIYILNTHATDTWYAPTVWISNEVSGGATFAIGLDPAGVGNGTTSGVMAVAANENTAPSGVSFSSPTLKDVGLVSPDLTPGNAFGIWFRRSAANTPALTNDAATITIAGDSGEGEVVTAGFGYGPFGSGPFGGSV